MKIISLQLSNILSFRHFDNVGDAEKISFDDDLNIIIGENGAGKSTALEVINFLFKRVLYKQYNINQDLYTQRSSINADQQKQILIPANNLSYNGFRLEPNWNTEDRQQAIRIMVKLDEIDKINLQFLQDNRGILTPWIGRYTTRGETAAANYSEIYTFNIILNKNGKSFLSNLWIACKILDMSTSRITISTKRLSLFTI